MSTEAIAKRTRLRNLQIGRVDLVDKGAAIGARITLTKRREPVAKEHPKMTVDEILSKLPEAERAVLAEALRASAAPPKMAEKAEEEKKPESEAETAMKRRIEAEANARIAAIEKRAAEAEANAKLAAEEIAKLRDIETTRVAVAKAERVKAGAIGLSIAETAEILKRADQGQPLTTELAGKLESHFKATAAVVEKSAIFRESGAPGSLDADSPAAQIEVLAKSLRAANPRLSDVEAKIAAYESRPDLYAQIRG